MDTPIVIGSKYSIIERAIMDQDRECVEILLKTPYKIQLDKLISFAQVYGSVDIRRIINVYLDKSLMSRLLHR